MKTMEELGRDAISRTLRYAKELFVLFSACTRQPYVNCDPETFDDEIWMYESEAAAREAAKALLEEKIPVGVARVDQASRLLFFTSLYTMGVNAITLTAGEKKGRIQLADFVKRKEPAGEEKKAWVENPQLHLTALYYMQELRKNAKPEITPRLMELQEEMNADFARGRFIAALPQEGKGIPLVKMKNGDVFLPLFTDALEYQKFNREKKFRAVAVETAKLPQLLPPEAKGVVINPLGVNLALTLHRAAPQRQQQKPLTVEQQVEAAMREAELAMQQSQTEGGDAPQAQ